MTRTAADTRPQLVIFDLDGTLTDSADGIVASFRHALGVIGAEVPAGDLATRIVGPPMHLTLATSRAEPAALRILEHFGLTGHFEVIAGAGVDGSRSSKADVLAHAADFTDPEVAAAAAAHVSTVPARREALCV